MRVNLFCKLNGAGLSRDALLLARELDAAGCNVTLAHPRAELGHADVNVFAEIPLPDQFKSARHNVLIPNPEWFESRWISLLPELDVWCKTTDAVRIFASPPCTPRSARFIGFTTVDQRRLDVPRERVCFHLAGYSRVKSTDVVLDLWGRHPEWPQLVVVQDRNNARPLYAPPRNLEYKAYVAEEDLVRLQNRALFHLCPSQYEGFGHYIGEALSVGAIVVTTGAPPMSELVPEHVGIHVAPVRTWQWGLAAAQAIDVSGLEGAVRAVLDLSPAQVEARSRAARELFEQRERDFRDALHAALRELA